jgi:hypothetical protein
MSTSAEGQPPPAGRGRGWLIVGALSITVTVAYGVLQYAFGVLLPFMHHDLGWSRTAITGAFSVALLNPRARYRTQGHEAVPRSDVARA